jgi:hypothetical protein
MVLLERSYNAKVKHPSNTLKERKIFASGERPGISLLIFNFE